MDAHKEHFVVRSSDLDGFARLSIGSLFGFLQDAAGVHADKLGVSMAKLQSEGFAWMLHRLRLEITRHPELHETLTVETWPTSFDRLYALRDFRLISTQSGELLARASSSWVVVDVAQRKVARLPEFIRNIPIPSKESLLSIESRRLAAAIEPESVRTFSVRRSDLDILGHVNNARYAEWASETVPDETWAQKELKGIDLVFRAECRYGDLVHSESAADSSADGKLHHRLVRKSDQQELVQAATEWHSRS